MRRFTKYEIYKYRKKYFIRKVLIIVTSFLFLGVIISGTTVAGVYLITKFNISPAKKQDINLNKNSVVIKKNEKSIVIVNNFQNLKNIQVFIENETIAKVNSNTINIDGNIQIQGLLNGNTTLQITADNAITKTINVVCGLLTSNDIWEISDKFIATPYGLYLSNFLVPVGNGNLNNFSRSDLLGLTQSWNYSNQFSTYLAVTTKGTYNQINSSPDGDFLNNLTKENFISVSKYIITTEGVYDPFFNSSNRIDTNGILDNLKYEDVWSNVQNIIVTSKGAYVLLNVGSSNYSLSIIGPSVLNKNEFLYSNDSFLITTKGIYTRYMNSFTNPILGTIGLEKNDIWACTNELAITSKGIFNKFGEPCLEEQLPNSLWKKDIFLAASNNYIVTTKGSFYSNGIEIAPDLLADLDPNNFLHATQYVILTTTGALYNNYQSETTSWVFIDNFVINKDEFIGMSNQNIITTNGIFRISAFQPIITQILTSLLPNLLPEEILAFSDSHIATTSGIFDNSGATVLIPNT